MVDVARHLGSFLPGAEPSPPGSDLLISGTYGAGKSDHGSLADRTGKVWRQDYLVFSRRGVHNAYNPTFAAACFALGAADQLVKDLGANCDEDKQDQMHKRVVSHRRITEKIPKYPPSYISRPLAYSILSSISHCGIWQTGSNINDCVTAGTWQKPHIMSEPIHVSGPFGCFLHRVRAGLSSKFFFSILFSA